MRFLVGGVGLVWLLTGCTVPKGPWTCASDSDCGESGLCDTARGFCYAKEDTESEFDGGTCPFTCAEYEACTAAGCRPRFTALTILSPASNAVLDGGTVELVAELTKNPMYAGTTEFPPALAFDATRANGGEKGELGAQTRYGGIYSIPWMPPATQAAFTLTAAYPGTDAGLSNSVNVTVDTVVPTFTITLSNPPPRAEASATQAEQRDLPLGSNDVYRRDESVTVTVSANEVVSSAVVTLVGIGPGGSPGQEMNVDLSSPGTCDGSPPFCRSATVNLSVPEMRAFRGIMVLRVTGADGAGNVGTASKDVKVTRWKWAFDATESIFSTPAVGAQGTIYFGTNLLNGTGKTFAVDPNGEQVWRALTGDVAGSPAVGAFTSGKEYVYVAAKKGATPILYGLDGDDGAAIAECTPSGGGTIQSAIAVGTSNVPVVGVRETGFGIYNVDGQGRIVGARPVVATSRCVETSGGTIPGVAARGAVVIKDSNIFYGTDDFKVTSFDLSTLANTPRSGWPQTTTDFTRGLAVLNEQIYGAAGDPSNRSEGNLFSIPTGGGMTGGSVELVYPTTATSRVFNLAIGGTSANSVAYIGAETASTQEILAVSVPAGGAPSARNPSNGTLRGAPVVAENDRLYTLSVIAASARVAAWVASTLAPQWELTGIQVLDNAAVDVSPTMDCHRNASGQVAPGLGTLYIAASTKLYAFVVDSPGMDPNAPWPKYQHDARNTGNPATPITDCP